VGEGVLGRVTRAVGDSGDYGDAPFPRVDGVLRCGPFGLDELATERGTPLFVYDGDRIVERLGRLRRAFAPLDPLVAYSVKANPNLGVLSLLVSQGAGADIVSGGELHRSLVVGLPAERILFAGVGKTRDEMRAGLEAGILSFNVESAQELHVLAEVAEAVGKPAPFGIRVNLDIDSAAFHKYTRTGHATSKFGVPGSEVEALFKKGVDSPWLEPRGLDIHIGSQISAVGPFLAALDGALATLDRVEEVTGCTLSYLDLGGGYAVSYGDSPEIELEDLGRQVAERFGDRPNLRLVVEPGRFLVGDAGVLLTEVLYIKRSGGKTFVVTDAGMTELIRPSHYGGLHPIEPVVAPSGEEQEIVDVVGPICETGDFLALDREMVLPEVGTLLAVHVAGAYGFTMASNYNSRRRPAEVLVRHGKAHLVRKRESYDDLIRGESTF